MNQYETFQRSGNQNFLRDILKRSADVYESSLSQFFRTTTEAATILYSFRLVLDGKAGKEITES